MDIAGSPSVEDDRVTLRIKVLGEGDRPVMGLWDTDFQLQVDGEPVQFSPQDWKSPEESTPPPAWIIVLLDMSGSMKAEDSRGTTKLAGAIQAIREFTKESADRGGNTQVAIVPFGEAGNVPECGHPVDDEALNKFFPAGDFKLQNNLDYLASLEPCASTNIYGPLTRAVRFLADGDDERFYPPEESNAVQPRLSIILLSDGYHNKPKEAEDFEDLLQLLQRNNNIIVHTLGYGLTPEELQAKYGLSAPAQRSDIDVGNGEGVIPEAEFVDRKRLTEIAEATGGIAEFSANSQAIAESLQLFLNALLGEYEITYTEPNAERGSKHEVVVIVDGEEGETVESDPEGYTIEVFGRSLPLPVRLIMLVTVLFILGVGGVVPFWFWGRHLEKQAT